jgi:hypothetical protein
MKNIGNENENKMRLDIKNIHNLLHTQYHKGRFICTDSVETPTNYRFQFKDTHAQSSRYVWVEISRMGEWDAADGGRWTYRLNYPNRPIHIVTAKWLGFPPNAVQLMEDCLKYSL